jgi:hypothetical protein
VVAGLAMCGVFCLWFGADDLVFNIWTLPKSHPWAGIPTRWIDPSTWVYGGHWAAKVRAIGYLMQRMWEGSALLWTLAAAALLSSWRASGSAERRAPFVPLSILSGLGIALVPVTTLAAVKVGGGLYDYEIMLYFIDAAVAVGLVWFLSFARDLGARNLFGHFMAVAALVAFGVAAVPSWGMYFKPGRGPSSSVTETVYRYLRAHPGQAYFPLHPLCHLFADGEMTHFEPGVYDREIGKFPLAPPAFRAGCPSRFSLIAYYQLESNEAVLRHFKLSAVAPPMELSDWKVFRVDGEAPPP